MAALCAWVAAHGSSCLELLCVVTGIPYVVLAMRQQIWAWPVGLVNAVVCGLVYRSEGLYSDAGLQVYYFATSLYGWYHWRRGSSGDVSLPIGRVSRRESVLLAAGAVVGWVVLGTGTARMPGASIPYYDAVPVTLSLVAQWMTARKLLENWSVWIVANTVYVGLYVYKGLYFLIGLTAVYLVLAVMGHIQWKRTFVRTSSA